MNDHEKLLQEIQDLRYERDTWHRVATTRLNEIRDLKDEVEMLKIAGPPKAARQPNPDCKACSTRTKRGFDGPCPACGAEMTRAELAVERVAPSASAQPEPWTEMHSVAQEYIAKHFGRGAAMSADAVNELVAMFVGVANEVRVTSPCRCLERLNALADKHAADARARNAEGNYDAARFLDRKAESYRSAARELHAEQEKG